jgi:hypothetical protein
MSNGLAISGVTAVLQYYLHQLYTSPPFTAGAVKVSSLAPDLIQQAFGNNPTDAENQVNLFLHQVTHNQSWRNVGLPSLAADGQTRLTNPPLALNLHYLLTVYASEYWEAEALLGFALMMLHENPVLARGEITNALTGLGLPYPHNPLTTPLASCGLADQVEMIKITPEALGREEMAWLWTALKADYRPTYPFQASVVLMQPQQQTTLATPVLRRRVRAQPIQSAVILQVSPPNHQIAAAPTDTVTVTGENLSGVAQVCSTIHDTPLLTRCLSPLYRRRSSLSFPTSRSPGFTTWLRSSRIRREQSRRRPIRCQSRLRPRCRPSWRMSRAATSPCRSAPTPSRGRASPWRLARVRRLRCPSPAA